jgi:hypothetical protein
MVATIAKLLMRRLFCGVYSKLNSQCLKKSRFVKYSPKLRHYSGPTAAKSGSLKGVLETVDGQTHS